jgi:ribosomal protein S18 acetylase RimI-like enzyme
VAHTQLLADADIYDGAVELLVLAKEVQGQGIGNFLWRTLAAYFAARHAQSIYLYCDAESNFGFYEHMGFARKQAQSILFIFNEWGYEMDYFLYDIQL